MAGLLSIDHASFHSTWRPWRDTPVADLEARAVAYRRAFHERDSRLYFGMGVCSLLVISILHFCGLFVVGSGLSVAQRLVILGVVLLPASIGLYAQTGEWWRRNYALTRRHRNELVGVLEELDVRRTMSLTARRKRPRSWLEFRQQFYSFIAE